MSSDSSAANVRESPFASAYSEGDRCGGCGFWYWERNGEGWHSLVPITFADTPELARIVECPVCQEAVRGE